MEVNEKLRYRKIPMLFKISGAQKEALDEWASAQGISASQAVRIAIAVLIDYDLAEDESILASLRPRKYKTEAERKEADRLRAREYREFVGGLVREYRRQEMLNDRRKLIDSLRKRGAKSDD